jgi:CBS domain-containing protein
MTASHLMEQALVCFQAADSCYEIAEAMVRENFGAVPIVNLAKRLIGIITEFDLLDAILRGEDLKKTPAAEVMSQPISITEEMLADEIIALLQARRLIRVPVVDSQGRLVGVVARRDVLAGYIESMSGPLPSF